MSNTEFSLNTAAGGESAGGGVCLVSAEATLTDVVFTSNSSAAYGGGVSRSTRTPCFKARAFLPTHRNWVAG